MYPHPIRLHGPWDYEVLSGETTKAQSGRVKLPCDWGSSLGWDFRGRVRYRRAFHRPSGLEPHEHVWLICEGADARAEVQLNGQGLGPVRGYALPSEFEITRLLGERNELLLDVDLPVEDSGSLLRPGRQHLPGGPLGEVRLEVRSGAFLERWGSWIESLGGRPTLQLKGHVASEWTDESLELVVRSADEELLYAPVKPGFAFSLHAKADHLSFWTPGEPRLTQIELRLIRGGTRVWQSQIKTAIRADAKLAAKRPLWPLSDPDLLPNLLRSFSQQIAETRSRLLLPSILSPTAYSAFDEAGVQVIQYLPPSWPDEVALRLAHHPSLAGWWCQQAPDEVYGRPCVLQLAQGC